MSSSVLDRELAQLQEQIGSVNRELEALERELRAGDEELEKVSGGRARFDALQDAVTALERLRSLKADELFWDGALDAPAAAAHLQRAKARVARFQQEIGGQLEKQTALRQRIDRCLDDLAVLQEDVRDAYDRDARRDEEYVIEREISPVPRSPWSRGAENEWPFRRALLIALLLAVFFGVAIPLLHVPVPERPPVVVVPERLVSMLKKEEPKPAPPKEEKEAEKKEETAKEEKKPEERPKPATPEEKAARKKAESSGVLAFRESFKDLIQDAPAPKLGAKARISNQPVVASRGRAGRSLVALPPSSGGYSGGIAASGISRDIGPGTADRVAAVGPVKVESKVAEMTEEAKPVASAGAGAPPGSARTDEEIQIVFDRYKASLYRMYNTELRRDPTLRGRIILRITIEPNGQVSDCTAKSNDLKSPELVAQIVARVKRFNFGPKANATRITILYPIDFLPGG